MGYTTDFYGQFDLSRPLTEDEAAFIKMFSGTRRMKRDPEKVKRLTGENKNAECFRLLAALSIPLGPEGDHYCGTDGPQPFGCAGQNHDNSIVDYNRPPASQPGLWCQWVPSEDRAHLEWDGGEKFYEYTEWLAYLIEHFFAPWGVVVNGSVEWQGEDHDDIGLIVVEDNMVSAKAGFRTYGD